MNFSPEEHPVVVAGAGAAGYFAAIACAEAAPGRPVIVCEATAHPLAKVRVSGGGRCNVTHACFDPKELVRNYPRGTKELLGAFHRWQPRDTVEWFESRGVTLKTEDDGRMFPATDDSATIVDCLREAAERAGVKIRLATPVAEARRTERTIEVVLGTGEVLNACRLLLSTGGNRSSAGYRIAESFGHSITPLVPSLFTFHIDDPRIKGLEGVSVPDGAASIPGRQARGPVLVTHWGLSGPAVLKLSAWAAPELAACGYNFEARISWVAGLKTGETKQALAACRSEHPKRQLSSWNPWSLPARLWERLVAASGAKPDLVWTSAPNRVLEALAQEVCEGRYQVAGKSLFKEEFVTCGGVRLSEVDFRTMESRLAPGLHFAGEILDVDGVTGGFNFQAAWTTGRLAGLAMAAPARQS
jgi:predicted Rossmann fold flavoprotein